LICINVAAPRFVSPEARPVGKDQQGGIMPRSSTLHSELVAISPLFAAPNQAKLIRGTGAAVLPFGAPEHVPHYLQAH
jgi:hypothetical protein